MNNLQLITENQRLGCCVVSVAPLRADKRDKSEQVSQILFGETIEILEFGMPWIKIRCMNDGYEGYSDIKQFIPLTQKELTRWMDASTILSTPIEQINTPWGKLYLSAGSVVGLEKSFNIGAIELHLENENNPVNHLTNDALKFLNTPYLWGGKSIFGIDCSGFTQLVFRMQGINLPRDASQQAEIGLHIEWGEQQAGDLAFFKNDEGKITHVGLVLGQNDIIHASGQVRMDELKRGGIFRNNHQTHHISHYTRI
jgi:gamma-D-glutamyl-L-lysine dipeptidyl-peptidase